MVNRYLEIKLLRLGMDSGEKRRRARGLILLSNKRRRMLLKYSWSNVWSLIAGNCYQRADQLGQTD